VTLGQSGTVSDNVTVRGNSTYGAPTGNVAFYICNTGTSQSLTPGACPVVSANHLSTDRLTTGADDTSTTSSVSFLPTSGGTWCFSAAYTSDSTYTSSADNSTAGNIDPGECVLVATAQSSTSSEVSSATVVLGPAGTLSDDVSVTGGTVAGAPTGDVAFYVCQTGTTQTLVTGPCPATGTPQDPGESLVAGAGDSSTASSNSFTPTAAGTWCFSAVYGGDANYGSSTDNTDAGTLDPYECALVTPGVSATSGTVSSTNVALGPTTSISDSAHVSGNSAGGAPAGTVTFYVCGPTTTVAACTSTSTPDGSQALTTSGADTSAATSRPFVPDSAGEYCFAALYSPTSGSNYTGSSDNAAGGTDAAQCVSIAPAPFTIITGDSAAAATGTTFSFTVRTAGTPVRTMKIKGKLPKGLHFAYGHNGTATISGTPNTRDAGSYVVRITALFGKGKGKHVAVQSFTINIT